MNRTTHNSYGLLLFIVFMLVGADVGHVLDEPSPQAPADDDTYVEACPGATHFYERHIKPPKWARRMDVVCVIGNHVFLKEKSSRDPGFN